MVIRRFAHLLLFAALALLASNSFAEEYVYVQAETDGAVPPEPFADDLEYDTSDLANSRAVESDAAMPAIDMLLQEIKPITQITASIIDKELNRPADRSQGLFLEPRPGIARTTNITQFNWQASNFLHRPLYFDDTPLERYGQSIKHTRLQPVVSGAKFFGTFAVLPYKMGIDRIGDCVSPLGYYRPGSCAPCVRERVIPAFEADAALMQAGTVMALILILP